MRKGMCPLRAAMCVPVVVCHILFICLFICLFVCVYLIRQREKEEGHYLQEKDSIRQRSADR